MSIEIIYYPKKARKEDLVKHLKSMDYYTTNHLWDWPKGSLHYHWFEEKDFISYDGVEATIYPVRVEEKTTYKCSDWALHTRTRVSASPSDIKMQNDVIRKAKQKYDGIFINDYSGRNKYTPVEDDNRDAPSRGIYLTYNYVIEQISSLKFAIPEPDEQLNSYKGTNLETLSEIDPTRVLYNALVPFAVASLERFFAQTFKILLKYNPESQKKIEKQSKKIELKDVLAIQSGNNSIEDIISSWYSFQNINSIHIAFDEWFGINFWSLIRRRKKVGQKIHSLEKSINKLIEFRHGVIHRFEIDRQLDKKQLIEVFEVVTALIEIFVDYLENNKNMIIRD
jgi:hypothetical protein